MVEGEVGAGHDLAVPRVNVLPLRLGLAAVVELLALGEAIQVENVLQVGLGLVLAEPRTRIDPQGSGPCRNK